MTVYEDLSAHARPPSPLRLVYKRWQKCSSVDDVASDRHVLDTAHLDQSSAVRSKSIPEASLDAMQTEFERFQPDCYEIQQPTSITCFEVNSLPGLFIFPALIPLPVQTALLDRLLHRDLENPVHKTNLHLHYKVAEFASVQASTLNTTSRLSFFDMDPGATFSPKDSTVHKPLPLRQALEKKLRWVTLGGQYDWTAKVYPDESPPEFPPDIARLLHAMFPTVDPQAAILNFYSPGDTLSLHRDVSEECDRGLISISIGCEALFLVANLDGINYTTIKLRSGDVLLMSGPSRYAWHAVPKVLAGTCPAELKDWPSQGSSQYRARWENWLANKRINLNIRQMKAET